MREPRTDTVAWETMMITYQYHRVRRRTLGVSVHPDLSVVVRVPVWTTREQIRQFVYEKAAWINKVRTRFERLPRQAPREYINDEIHQYLGQDYLLKVEQGERESVNYSGECLLVTLTGEPQSERVKRLLMAWYKDRAEIVFHERLELWLQKTAGIGTPEPRITIRKMTSRWGSCSAHNRITLNLLLMTVPMECIDYVVLHELCHFKVRRHGPRFWGLMERLMPDYKERRKTLNTYIL